MARYSPVCVKVPLPNPAYPFLCTPSQACISLHHLAVDMLARCVVVPRRTVCLMRIHTVTHSLPLSCPPTPSKCWHRRTLRQREKHKQTYPHTHRMSGRKIANPPLQHRSKKSIPLESRGNLIFCTLNKISASRCLPDSSLPPPTPQIVSCVSESRVHGRRDDAFSFTCMCAYPLLSGSNLKALRSEACQQRCSC